MLSSDFLWKIGGWFFSDKYFLMRSDISWFFVGNTDTVCYSPVTVVVAPQKTDFCGMGSRSKLVKSVYSIATFLGKICKFETTSGISST